MLQKVESYIRNKKMLSPQANVIVGLSGGADSVALLQLLHSAGYNCVAAHCNFHLRGDESNRDEDFVTHWVHEMGIPLHKISFDTKAYAAQQKISIEMAARDLRYAWFESLRTTLNADAIAIAHHADDNAETLLLNLVRGTGIRGLCGIRPTNGHVVRPLLTTTRHEIEEYLTAQGLAYVTDSSNHLSDFTRNKLRNIVIPVLEEINPSVRQTLNENIRRFEDVYKIYEEAIREKSNNILTKSGNKTLINIELLRNESAPETLLYEFVKAYEFHPDQIKAVIESLDHESGKSFYSENYRLIKDREFLIVTNRVVDQQMPYSIDKHVTKITEPIKLTVRKLKNDSSFVVSKASDCIHVDADLLRFPLSIRKWQEGDYFVPFGMHGRKKLSDFFIDQKLSIADKDESFILLSGDEIVWIIGRRTDNRFRITNTTENILEIKLDK